MLSPGDGYGDVDLDGQVTPADAELAARFSSRQMALTQEQQRRADVDGDGAVSVVDALFIAQFVQGLIATFPVLLARPPRPGGLGDVDGDGSVTIADYHALPGLYGPVATEAQRRADLNGDGVVDGRDLGLQREYLWGMRHSFPAESMPAWRAVVQGSAAAVALGFLGNAALGMARGR